MFIQNYVYLDDGRTKINFSEYAGDGNKPNNKMICENDAPKESFGKMLSEVKSLFISLSEQSVDAKNVRIKRISFKKTGKDEVVKVSFVGLVGLAKSSGYNEVKTVEYFTSQPESAAGKNVLTVPQIAVVDSIVSECKDYVNGDRLQIEANLEDEEDNDEDTREETGNGSTSPASE